MTNPQHIGRLMTLQPANCNKCYLANCFALHDYAGKDCSLQSCDVCPRLAVIDAVIDKYQNALIHLATVRREMKRQINSRHDHLTTRLPVEVVSSIFIFYADSAYRIAYRSHTNAMKQLLPALLLGSVSKRWRDITIQIPQLWTNVVIDPCKDAARFEVTQEWLRRSGGLPLSMKFIGRNRTVSDDNLPILQPMLALLRAHAERWRYVVFNVPTYLLEGLLGGLEVSPQVTDLVIDPTDRHGLPVEPIFMHEPFRPRFLFAKNYFPPDGSFVRWENLTIVVIKSIKADALIHLIGHASRMETLEATDIRAAEDEYPLNTHHVTNKSLKKLTTEASQFQPDFITGLILPSLDILHFHMSLDPEHSRRAIIGLRTFLRFSTPPLTHFCFLYYPRGDIVVVPSIYIEFPQITDLVCVINDGDDTDDFIDQMFLALSYDKEDTAHPNLRTLRLTTHWILPDSWALLANIFPPSGGSEPATVDTLDVSALSLETQTGPLPSIVLGPPKRPLKTVVFRLSDYDLDNVMEERIYFRFVDIQKSGVRLIVTPAAKQDMDLLQCIAENYDYEGVFDPYADSESDDEYEDTADDGEQGEQSEDSDDDESEEESEEEDREKDDDDNNSDSND